MAHQFFWTNIQCRGPHIIYHLKGHGKVVVWHQGYLKGWLSSICVNRRGSLHKHIYEGGMSRWVDHLRKGWGKRQVPPPHHLTPQPPSNISNIQLYCTVLRFQQAPGTQVWNSAMLTLHCTSANKYFTCIKQRMYCANINVSSNSKDVSIHTVQHRGMFDVLTPIIQVDCCFYTSL